MAVPPVTLAVSVKSLAVFGAAAGYHLDDLHRSGLVAAAVVYVLVTSQLQPLPVHLPVAFVHPAENVVVKFATAAWLTV